MTRFDETNADPTNHPRRVTEPDRYGYRPVHDEEQPCLGCGKTVTFDEDIDHWWIPYLGTGNVPNGTFNCPGGGVAGRHAGSVPRVTPNDTLRDHRIRQIADMVAYMDLHIGRFHIKQMTTEQKELWADLVDANGVQEAREDPTYLDPDGVPPRSTRWWRSDYAGPTSPEDPRWHSHGRHEPDPFAWAAEPRDAATEA